ncbi:hypothetical protein J7J62_07695 [bacterium]|nr:hypothetical protein [bacterium]
MAFMGKFIEDIEFDIAVQMPPLKEWFVRVKIKSIEEAKPCIIENFIQNEKKLNEL